MLIEIASCKTGSHYYCKGDYYRPVIKGFPVNEEIIHSEAELVDALRKVLDKSIFRIVIREGALSFHRPDLTVIRAWM